VDGEGQGNAGDDPIGLRVDLAVHLLALDSPKSDEDSPKSEIDEESGTP
jgi:hypothetical protein